MFRFAIPAAAAIGLFAAAAQSSATNTPATARDEAMGWHLSREGETAKLAYGLANSDQLALMLTCEPGQALATVYGEVQPDSPRLIHASAGPVDIDPLGGDLLDEVRIPTADGTLRRFLRTGSLAVEGETGKFSLTANPEERRLVDAFFSWCGAEQA